MLQLEFPIGAWASADSPVCIQCGMYEQSPPGDAFLGAFLDQRELGDDVPSILVVFPGFAGDFIGTAGGDQILSILDCLEGVRWAVTGTYRCGRAKGVRAKVNLELQRECTVNWLGLDMKSVNPKAIVLLGLDSAKVVMASAAPRSISRSTQSIFHLDGLGDTTPPILIGQSPWAHRPHEGADLMDEWCELFNRACRIALQVEASLKFDYQEISDFTQAMEVAEQVSQHFTFDVEVDHHVLDANRRTYWHDGSELLCVSASWVEPGGKRGAVTFLPPACRRQELWHKLMQGSSPEGHFVKYDFQTAWARTRYEIFKWIKRLPTGEADVHDTAAKINLGNQAIPGLGLLPLAVKHFGVPNWKDETKVDIATVNQDLMTAWDEHTNALAHNQKRARYMHLAHTEEGEKRSKAIKWLKTKNNGQRHVPMPPDQPPGSAGFSASIPRLYLRCARDTWLTARLGDEIVPKVIEENGGAPGDIAYRWFCRIFELTCKVERAGILVDPKRLEAATRVFNHHTIEGKKTLLAYPEVLRAVVASEDFQKDVLKRNKDPFTSALEHLNPQSPQFRLRLAVEMGINLDDLPRTKGSAGKPGGPSTDKYVVAALSGEGAPWDTLDYSEKVWRQFAKTKSINDLEAKLNTFRWLDSRNRIHTDYKIIKSAGGTERSEEAGGSTRGTACVAEGTFIECPRDLVKHPHGIPIEDIKVGDMVYSYDDKGEFSLRKVLWAGQTGVKATVRVCWKGDSTSKNTGDLYLTPEHRVRRIDGTWCQAKDLRSGDRVMSVTRHLSNNYPYIGIKGGLKVREHVFVLQQLGYDTQGKHVHHKHGTLDNRICALEVLTPQEHKDRHPLTEEQKIRQGLFLNTLETRKKQLASIKHGKEHARYLNIDRFTLLRRLALCQGGPKKVAIRYNLDYTTVIRQCKDLSVDYKAISSRYGGDGKFLSRGRVKEALSKDYRSRNDIQKVLRLGYYPVRKLANYYGLNGFNHTIVSVSSGPVLPVYNLTVEGTHSFIGNQVSLRNSSNPNMQNIKKDPAFRALFVAAPGKCFIEADYAQGEPRVLAFVANCPGWKEIYQRDLDIYRVMANAVYQLGVSMSLPDDKLRAELEKHVPKDMRNGMKTRLLAVMYQESIRSFAKKSGLPEAEVEDFFKKLFGAYPEIKRYQNMQYETMMQGLPVVNLFGRQELHAMPDPREKDYHAKVAKIHRSRGNFPIQCLPEGTMVLTRSGYRPIELCNNLQVWDGSDWSLALLHGGVEKPEWLLSTSEGDIHASKDHHFETTRGWLPLEDLQITDCILRKDHYSPDGDVWGDPDFAEFIGLMLGNGSCQKKGGRYTSGGSLVVGYKEADLLTWLLPRLETWAGSVRSCPSGQTVHTTLMHYRDRPSYYRVGVKVSVLRILEDFGYVVGATASNKSIPEKLFTALPTVRRSLLRGLFTSDGGITGDASNGFCVCYTSVSRELAYGVLQLLSSLGIAASVKALKVSKGGNFAPYRVSIRTYSLNDFHQLVGFRSEVKQKLLDVIIAYNACISVQGGKSRPEAKVLGVQATGRSVKMWDLEVQSPRHAFVVNGLSVHNSGLNDIVTWLGWVVQRHIETLGWHDTEKPMDSDVALVALIHDAIYGEVRLDLASQYASLVDQTLSNIKLLPFAYDVPMSVSFKVGADLSKLVECHLVNGKITPDKEDERKYLPPGLV
jgi:DNA polymerase I-like protein with 3'-5' exonuclease and polymerase domains